MQKESWAGSYGVWYAPVQRTLACLSKLYSCLEPGVFAGLAQDALAACIQAVQVLPQAIALTCEPCRFTACTWAAMVSQSHRTLVAGPPVQALQLPGAWV